MASPRFPLLPAWLRWVGVLAVGVAIFYLSIVMAPPPTEVVPGRPDPVPLDKWRHFLAYGALGWALAYATVDWDWRTRWVTVVVLAVVVAYGVGLEFWQSMVPDRHFSVGDAYANALGGVLAVPLFVLRDRLRFVPLNQFVDGLRQ